MIEYFYDDVFHFQNSCPSMLNQPGYRPLINIAMCLSRGNLLVIRSLSGLCIFMGLYLLGSLFLQEKREKLLFTLVGLHPVLAFPFIYASQISTSMTFLWAAWVTKTLFHGSRWWPLLLGSMLGIFFRYEAVYFFMITAIAVALIRVSAGLSNEKLGFRLLKTAVPKALALRFVAAVVAFFTSSFFFQKSMRGLPSQMDVFSVYSAGTVDFYPSSSHFFVQIYAQLLYLKALFVPVLASFFGPWFHWLEIHANPGYQWALAAGFAAFLGTAAFFIFRSKTSKSHRAFWTALALFLGTSMALSFRVRHDWYFLSRAFLGTSFFMLVLFQVLKPKWRWVLLGYCGASFALALTYQYSSLQSLHRWERQTSRELHPYFMEFNKDILAYSDQERIDYLLGPYRRIKPYNVLDDSVTARKYAYENLKRAFLIANKINDEGTINLVLDELSPSPIYVSTFVQMVAGKITEPSQVYGERKTNLCNSVFKRQHNPKFDQILPFDLYFFCGAKRPN